jgi:RNA polymerase sigma-70 factor (ECF subfamily)
MRLGVSPMVRFGEPHEDGVTGRAGTRTSKSEEVVESARMDEPLTIERLFTRHVDQVFRIVASLLGPGASRADVQDLVQQVFLAAHRALPRFRGESAPLTWLYGIASRIVLMHLRSWGRQRRLRLALEIEPVREANLEDTVIQRDELRRVWRALMRIPPKMRIVYVMYEIEGLSGKEIADALDVPEATVRTRLLHGRRALAKALKRELGGERS